MVRLLPLLLALALLTGCQPDDLGMQIKAPADAKEVIATVFAPDGTGINTLTLGPGARNVVWDGLNQRTPAVNPASPGAYTWKAFSHQGFELKISGAACLNRTPEKALPVDEVNPWGGVGGTPTSVATNATHVFLGWSGGQIVACDLDGGIKWSINLLDDAACQALAVDGNVLVVLSSSDAGDALIKLDIETGETVNFGEALSLPLTALWPADSTAKPAHADALAAQSDHVYLSFTELQFIAVVKTSTGEYLQTVVGPPPSSIAVVPTRTENPQAAGTLMDADFAMVALQGGVLGRVLFAHDPLWVMMSDMQPLDTDEHITALTLLGDGAPHHQHSIFVGLDQPYQQVQRRSVLGGEGFLWLAGAGGGRPILGPWNRDALAKVNALALDGRGRLWVAEADNVPPRFSVWETEGTQGHLQHEFFGPAERHDTGATVWPEDPTVLIGAGCEWRIDPTGGPAKCLGIITRDGMRVAGFRRSPEGKWWLYVRHRDETVSVFERKGDGDYELLRPHSREEDDRIDPSAEFINKTDGETYRAYYHDTGQEESIWVSGKPTNPAVGFDPASGDYGVGYGGVPLEGTHPGIAAQSADGKIYIAVAKGGLLRYEVSGFDKVKPAGSGRLTVRVQPK
jgi:hypothetical protein